MAAVCLPAVADRIDLAALTAIDAPEQALRIIEHYPGEILDLHHVETISPRAAQVLARHDADIVLRAVRRLDAATAAAWNDFRHTLALEGITTLDKEAAAALADCDAAIALGNLQALTDVDLATKLAGQTQYLVFRQLAAVPAPVADALAQGKCGLALPRLERLDHPGLASKLLNGGSYPCVFEKLTLLDVNTAQALCTSPCNIYFKALANMPPDVAKALEGHSGVLDLDQLENVEPAVAASLLKNQGPLDLGGCDGFVIKGQPVAAEVLDALANHASSLTLSDLDAIPADLVAAIRRRTHHTVLPHVSCVTREIATGLAEKGGIKGVVWLTNVDRVEPANGLHPGAIPTLLAIKPLPVPADAAGPPAIILPGTLRQTIPNGHADGIEKHPIIHFNNQLGP